MSDTVDGEGTVGENSSEITLRKINRNSSKKVRRNDSEGDPVIHQHVGSVPGGQVETQRNGDTLPGNFLRENAGVHERLTGMNTHVYMGVYDLIVIVIFHLLQRHPRRLHNFMSMQVDTMKPMLWI